MTIRIIHGDCLERLADLPDRSVHCCVTSPPYWGLRDYGAGPGSKLSQTASEQRPRLQSGFGLRSKDLKPKDLIGVPWMVAFALRADGWYLRKDIIWAKPNPMPESAVDRPTSSHEHVFLLAKAQRYFFDAEAVREAGESGPSDLKKMAEALPRIGGKHKTLEDPLARASASTNMGQKRSVGEPGTRNVRDVWTIATAPFPDAHFATFPPELAERCIKAGTSEKGCCSACGAPWRRLTIKGEPDMDHRASSGADASGGYSGQSIKDHDAHGIQNASDVKRRILEGMRLKEYEWEPSCRCVGASIQPCTVLEPFAGAFTTALVADRLQRHAIGIELNEAYCEMARRRLTDDAGMFADLTTGAAP